MIFDDLARLGSTTFKPFALLCLAALAPSLAWSDNDGMDPSSILIKEAQRYVVQRDGSYVQTEEELVQVAQESGVSAAGQRPYTFQPAIETLEFVEAYTEKPDGRRIMVPPDQIKLQQQGQAAGASAFQDVQVQTILFPQVAVGDKLYAKTRLTRHRALLPGQFSDLSYPEARATREFSLTYDLPADMPLHTDAVGFRLASTTTADGRKVHRWEYVPADVPRLESDTISALDFGPRLAVSTFEDLAQLGRAYDRLASPATATSVRVKTLVDSLVKDLSDPRSKALAIDTWMRRNVRYVSVAMQNTSLLPHSADAVLESMHGDCQDHAALMQAMLAAAGIDSTPALVDAGNSYRRPAVASLDQFNHLIVYVPSLDLYLDSTAVNLGAGYLRPETLDKWVVLTRTGEVRHTPVSQPGSAWSQYRLRIAADGSATLDFTRGSQGWLEENVRNAMSNMSATDRAVQVTSLLQQKGMRGSGTLDIDDATQPGRGYVFSQHGKVDNWAYLPGTVGVYADSGFYAGVSWALHAMTNEARRTQPYLCPDNDLTEDAVFELPAGASVLALPRDTRVDSPYFQYQAEFRLQGQTLRVHRRLKSGKAGTRVCTPEDFKAMQPDIGKMMHDVRSQFILKMPEQRTGVASIAPPAL